MSTLPIFGKGFPLGGVSGNGFMVMAANAQNNPPRLSDG
jgi:hypothetical protein